MSTYFADNLNRFLYQNKKTRKEFASDIGVPYTTVTEWIKGRSVPKMDKVQMVAEYFHCSISEILEEYRPVPETDAEIIEAYRNADETVKAMVRRLLAYNGKLKIGSERVDNEIEPLE